MHGRGFGTYESAYDDEVEKPVAPERPRDTHFCKVRKAGERHWSFLGKNGTTVGLRIHALRLTAERAEALAMEIPRDNAGWEAKPQAIAISDEARTRK